MKLAQLSLDPSLRATGVAMWVDGKLTRVVVIKVKAPARGPDAWQAQGRALRGWIQGYTITQMWSERATLYTEDQKLTPEGFYQLTGVLGALSMVCPLAPMRAYHASQWKGTVAKDVFCKRIYDHLSPEEQAVVDAWGPDGKYKTDVLDATGVGLVAQYRL